MHTRCSSLADAECLCCKTKVWVIHIKYTVCKKKNVVNKLSCKNSAWWKCIWHVIFAIVHYYFVGPYKSPPPPTHRHWRRIQPWWFPACVLVRSAAATGSERPAETRCSCCAGASQISRTWAMCCPTYTRQLCEYINKSSTVNPACAALDRKAFVWVCVLGRVPRLPAAIRKAQRRKALCCVTPAEGGVLQSRAARAWQLCGRKTRCFRSHTLRWDNNTVAWNNTHCSFGHRLQSGASNAPDTSKHSDGWTATLSFQFLLVSQV